MRMGNMADAAPEALGFEVGTTSLDAARATMRTQGFTGVTESEFAAPDGPVLAVLGADYQSRVHVFRGGVYAESLTLPSRGWPPYGLQLRIGADDTSNLLLVLYRDPLGRPGEPPAIQSYREHQSGYPYDEGEPRFEPSGHASLEHVAKRHGGMTSPLFVGASLSDGVLLVARNRDGSLWNRGYLVRTKPRSVELQAMPMTSALRCSCVDAYSFKNPKL